MIHILLLGLILCTAMAQRPSFAGTRVIGVPELASRFANNTSDGNSSVSSSSGIDFPNRLGADGTSSTMKIPVDARGDENLVKRLETWPRENQPFWLLNAQQIENQRNPAGTRNNAPTTSQGSSQSSVINRNGGVDDGEKGSNCFLQPDSTQFTVMGPKGSLKTYVYDPVRDGWFPRNNNLNHFQT